MYIRRHATIIKQRQYYNVSEATAPPSSSGNLRSIHERNEGTSSAILLGKDELVINLGMLPEGQNEIHVTESIDSPPASLLVAILQSTSAPFAASDTLSTETYFPLTVEASFPCFGGQSGCSNGIDTWIQLLP
jgi:hypothetical protein